MRVLVVEDDLISSRILERTLARWDYEVRAVTNSEDAWGLIEEHRFRLVIADRMLPGADGIALCRRVRAANLGSYVYFIFLTSRNRKQDVIEGMAAGADDYLTKPVQPDELRVRLKAAERILQLEDDLVNANNQLAEVAATDVLTGLLNRRTILQRLAEELDRAHRERSPLSLIMLDVDDFKHINDSYGHGVGDRVLAEIASHIGKAARFYDLAGRYGGDEFLLAAPGADLVAAASLAERIRRDISELPMPVGSEMQQVTCSLGVAALAIGGRETLDSLIARADGAAYESKSRGRDRVSVAPPPGSSDKSARAGSAQTTAGNPHGDRTARAA